LAFGILAAYCHAQKTGVGQVVDAAMVDGAASLATMFYAFQQMGEWNAKRGTNIIDSGAYFYDVYETSDAKLISIAAIERRFHDEMLRKIGIEDRILKKPGALTPDEFEVMKTHTTKGANILRSVEQLKDMLPGIELHHESLDGRGYPYGLKGDQIPLMPRIITVADTFDAMTTNRPYQAAMDPEYVIRIINSLGSTKFDPQVVGALTRVFQSGKLRIRRAATMGPDEMLPTESTATAPTASNASAD